MVRPAILSATVVNVSGSLFRTAPIKQTRGNLLHPKRSFPAGRALAATFVGVKFVDVVQRPDHVARVIHHDDSAGSRHGAGRRQGVEIDANVVDPDLFFDGSSVRLLVLDLVTFVRP